MGKLFICTSKKRAGGNGRNKKKMRCGDQLSESEKVLSAVQLRRIYTEFEFTPRNILKTVNA